MDVVAAERRERDVHAIDRDCELIRNRQRASLDLDQRDEHVSRARGLDGGAPFRAVAHQWGHCAGEVGRELDALPGGVDEGQG